MKTPILGQSYVARSVNAAASRMVNLFPEITEEGKEAAFLQRAPGLTGVTNVRIPLQQSGPIRGMLVVKDILYIVSGEQFFSIQTGPAWTPVNTPGLIPGTGPVSMADNGAQIFIAANGPSFIYDIANNTLSPITDPDFPGAETVTFLDGYFVFNEPLSQKIWITSLLDGTQIDPLDFRSAEVSSDRAVAVLADHQELWIFGVNSTEVWYNAASPDFPLSPIQGAYNEIGCAARFSVAKLDNSIFWLGSDARGKGIVYRADGYIGKRVSTHALEWQIQQYSRIDDAIAYSYQLDGHQFYVLTFPTADATWVYDASTGAWHERASYLSGAFHRHRSNCQAAFNGKIVVGDFETDRLYIFDPAVFSDDGVIQPWLRSWRALPPGKNDLKRSAHHSLQLDCETGVGLPGNIAPIVGNDSRFTDPQVMLRWSDDGGHTWSNEHWRSMGKIGEYGYRTIWRRLGMTDKLRDRVYEVSGSDPVRVYIMGAELIGSPTNG